MRLINEETSSKWLNDDQACLLIVLSLHFINSVFFFVIKVIFSKYLRNFIVSGHTVRQKEC